MTEADNSQLNITPFEHEICAEDRANIKNQKAICIWLTGLSGSGKSSIANRLDARLHKAGFHSVILDGDNIRNGLCKDLGFSDQDRGENIRRVAEVARLMQQAGLIVIVAFISPFRAERNSARALFIVDEFFEIYLDTPLQVCEARDPKGLYKKARGGELRNFTGLDSPYESPLSPDLKIDTSEIEIDECISMIIEKCAIKIRDR